MKIKTQLVFPPAWEITQPYLSIPSLYAYLAKKGMEVSQMDLNIIFFDEILSGKYMKITEKKITDRFNKYEGNEKKLAESTILFMPMLIEKMNHMKSILRGDKDITVYQYGKCRNVFARGLESISLANHPEKISFTHYSGLFDGSSVDGILKNIRERERSFLYEIYRKYLPKIVKGKNLVGISISGENQVIPSFILASMIKEFDKDIKIFIGGNVVTRWKEKIFESEKLFEYVDYMLIYEGEKGIEKLIGILEEHGDIRDVPNVFFRDENGEVLFSKGDSRVEINELPTPEFDENNMDKYFWHEPVLPLLTSRGCYWGRCAFCDHSYVYKGRYQRRDPKLIAEDISKLNEKYGVRNINFHDEAIKPEGFEELIEAVALVKEDIKWSCDARFDRKLTADLLKRAYDIGLRVIFFGLESGNQRVLNFMRKGIEVKTIKRILKESNDCGIWNHAFFFLGFPTETEEESKETLRFLEDNEENIRSFGGSMFSLGKFSTVAMEPERYHIEELGIENQLSLRRRFNYLKGTDKYKVKRVLKDSILMSRRKTTEPHQIICRDHWVEFSRKPHWRVVKDKKIRLKSHVIIEEKEDMFRLMDIKELRIVSLHKNTKEILNMIEKGSNNEEIYEFIKIKYNSNIEEAEESIKPLLEKLRELGML